MKALIVYMKPVSKIEQKDLAKIISIIEENFKCKIRERDRIHTVDVNSFDVIFTIGGDGTFLKVTRYVLNNTPIFSVNMDVVNKEGFYTTANVNDIKIKIEKFLKGKHKIVKLNRLECYINDKKLKRLATNEIFIGNDHSYESAKYWVWYKGKKQLQKSSGIIIATPSGSHAWYKSAGGKPFTKGVRYIVREPYCGRHIKCSMKFGAINRVFKVQSMMNKGMVALDSAIHYPLKYNDVVKIKESKKKISCVRV